MAHLSSCAEVKLRKTQERVYCIQGLRVMGQHFVFFQRVILYHKDLLGVVRKQRRLGSSKSEAKLNSLRLKIKTGVVFEQYAMYE